MCDAQRIPSDWRIIRECPTNSPISAPSPPPLSPPKSSAWNGIYWIGPVSYRVLIRCSNCVSAVPARKFPKYMHWNIRDWPVCFFAALNAVWHSGARVSALHMCLSIKYVCTRSIRSQTRSNCSVWAIGVGRYSIHFMYNRVRFNCEELCMSNLVWCSSIRLFQ